MELSDKELLDLQIRFNRYVRRTKEQIANFKDRNINWSLQVAVETLVNMSIDLGRIQVIYKTLKKDDKLTSEMKNTVQEIIQGIATARDLFIKNTQEACPSAAAAKNSDDFFIVG